MINAVYQLVSPKVFGVAYQELDPGAGVLVRPEYLSICRADQRYYLGQRDRKVLRKKLPMALIHECAARVVNDPEGVFSPGQKVVLVPNTPCRETGEIYENYAEGSFFRSSGADGFMQEYVLLPRDRIVPYEGIDPKLAAISEFVSVGVHAVSRMDRVAHSRRERIGIWGDGSLAYVVACVLRSRFPKARIAVIGLDERKLSHFSFVDETHIAQELPEGFCVDHAFECCGGEGSVHAIDEVISCIRPQGALMLMGVSESNVPVCTRMVLEKGLLLVGCSRSGRADFEAAVAMMEDKKWQHRLSVITSYAGEAAALSDVQRIFAEGLNTPFKTVFGWNL